MRKSLPGPFSRLAEFIGYRNAIVEVVSCTLTSAYPDAGQMCVELSWYLLEIC
jgi:hypothetical protein